MMMYESSSIGVPMFARMEVYLSVLGYDIWKFVINGYFVHASPPIDPESKRRYQCNSKSMKAILNGLLDIVSSEVDRCKSAKSLWDRLKKLYGEEPTIIGSDCEKIYEANKCEVDKCRLVSCCSEDKNGSHLLMPQGTQDAERTSFYDSVSQSYN